MEMRENFIHNNAREPSGDFDTELEGSRKFKSTLEDNKLVTINRPEQDLRFFGKDCEPFEYAHDSPQANAQPSVLRFSPGDTPF